MRVGVGVWINGGVDRRAGVGVGLPDDVAVGPSSWANLTMTVWLELISTFAVLPTTAKTGPIHSPIFQPGLGRTSMVTTLPEIYPPFPNGVGFRRKSAASRGSAITSSLWVIVEDVGDVGGAAPGAGRDVRVGEGLVDWGAAHDANRKSIKMLPAMAAKFVTEM